MSTITATRPATDRQRSFIERLLAEKNTAGTYYEGWTPDWSRATTKAASSVIDYLLTLPAKPRSSTKDKEIPVGVYSDGDTIYRVYMGQQSGKALAKEVVVHSDGPLASDQYVDYIYRGAASRFITEDFRRLSLAEVGKLGKAFDHCLMCGRRLDDPESVDRGIGPVCAAKYEG